MSFIESFWRGATELAKEMRGLSLTDADQWQELGLITPTASGVNVTTEGALKYAAVFACVRVLAGTLAQMPLILYRRRDNDARERATDHRLYDLLHNRPNPVMTSFNFRMALGGHLALWGNAYAEIEYDNGGRVRALWPLRPDKMRKVELAGDGLLYTYELPGGQTTVLSGASVLHLRFMSPDGIMGYSPIALHRQGVGLGLAAEEFGARFFGNDARPGSVLRHPGVLSDKAHKHLRESWNARHQGLSRAHRMAILEEGMELQEIGIPPEDAQYIELRKFQRTDIAGIYGVPPHMIMDVDGSTSWGTGIEQQSIGFVVYTMGPWLACWEQGLDTALLTQRERQELYTEFLVEGLLRGDSAARGAFYREMFMIGAYSQNDIRRRENENPIDGGDTYYVPLNMIPSDQAASGFGFSPPADDEGRMVRSLRQHAPDEQRARQAAASRHRLQQAQARVYADVAGRLLRREANDIGNAARRFLQNRSLREFDQWLREFYEEYKDVVASNMRPVAQAYAELVAGEAQREVGGEIDEERLARFIQAYVARQGVRHVARNEARLRRILVENPDDLLAEIEQELELWRTDERARSFAQDESVRAGNAVAHFAYTVLGVQVLRWAAVGESCPYCESQNGRVVSITEVFVPAGSSLEPDGADEPMQVTRNIGHPPLHAGCDCVITAG